VIEDFAAVFSRWRTWFLMANQDLALRYRRSVIGPFWISIAMAVMVLGIGLLFSEVQQQPFKKFLAFFGCGLLAWSFITTCIVEGAQLIIESEGHMRNVRLPVPVVAAKVVYRNFLIFLHNAFVVGGMLLFIGTPITPVALQAVAAILLFVPMCLFLATALGPICTRFRDLPQVITSAVQLGFFLTPIFWMPHSAMSRPVLFEANPFYHLVEIFRRPLLGQPATELNWIVSIGCLLFAIAFAVVSLTVTRRRVYLWL
jgi:lipopolysaccharide transport system permease protein